MRTLTPSLVLTAILFSLSVVGAIVLVVLAGTEALASLAMVFAALAQLAEMPRRSVADDVDRPTEPESEVGRDGPAEPDQGLATESATAGG